MSELQGLQSRLPEIQTLDAEVLAISADTPAENRRVAESAELEFPILADTQGEAMDAFGVRHRGGGLHGNDIARPAVFILDREGRITWRALTSNWRVRVRPETVLEQLERIP